MTYFSKDLLQALNFQNDEMLEKQVKSAKNKLFSYFSVSKAEWAKFETKTLYNCIKTCAIYTHNCCANLHISKGDFTVSESYVCVN